MYPSQCTVCTEEIMVQIEASTPLRPTSSADERRYDTFAGVHGKIVYTETRVARARAQDCWQLLLHLAKREVGPFPTATMSNAATITLAEVFDQEDMWTDYSWITHPSNRVGHHSLALLCYAVVPSLVARARAMA